MKKNKDTKPNSRWQHWRQSPPSLKTLFFGFIFSIIFILTVVILIHRQMYPIQIPPDLNFQSTTRLPEVSPSASTIAPLQEETPAPALVLDPSLSSPNLSEISLHQLENKLKQVDTLTYISQRLVAIQLLQEILEGRLPLHALQHFLSFNYQKTSDPWALNFINQISLVKEYKTYSQLEAMLIPPSEPTSHWTNIKKILKSFVRIRKLDKEGHYLISNREDIKIALRANNIEQALEVFEKLPLDEQAQLASWKQYADGRLIIETIKKKILLELSEVY